MPSILVGLGFLVLHVYKIGANGGMQSHKETDSRIIAAEPRGELELHKMERVIKSNRTEIFVFR